MPTTLRKASAVQLVKDPNAVSVKGAGVQAFASDIGVNLRQFTGYAFETPLPGVNLRQVAGYAFQKVAPILPINKTGNLAMYDLINQNKLVALTFSASNTTLGTPSAQTPDADGRDTVVNLRALGASGFSGNMNFTYARRNLADAFTSQFSITPPASATTVYAMLAQINTAYNLNLVQSDLVDGPWPANQKFINLTAGPGSYLFKPGSTASAGLQPALATLLQQTNLPGFDNASGTGPITQSPTVLLMHFDDAAGAVPKDVMGHTVSVVGGAAIQNTTAKFGSGALLPSSTNANGAYVQVADAPELRLDGDFTIEFQVYLNNLTQDAYLFSKGTTGIIRFYKGSFYATSDRVNQQIVGGTLVASAWQHVAVQRAGNVWTMFVNGVLSGEATEVSGLGSTGTAPWTIGGVSGGGSLNGYLDEIRISRIARYTNGTFTPPTAPYTIDNSSIRIADVFPNKIFFNPITANTTVSAYLATLNAVQGTTLQASEIVDGPINAGATSITITIGTSYRYRPGSSVTLNLYQGNALALMHFDGASGDLFTTDAVGRGVVPIAPAGAAGGPRLTGASSKFGATSLAPYGTNTYQMTLNDAPDLRLTDNFTIEAWVNASTISQTGVVFAKDVSVSNSAHLTFNSGTWQLFCDSNNVLNLTVASGMVANQWYHIALVKRKGVYTLYQNGVALASVTLANTFGNQAAPFIVGQWGGQNAYFQGYIDEVRISRVARYNGTFTPPTAPFALGSADLMTLAQTFPSAAYKYSFVPPSSDTTILGMLAQLNQVSGVNLTNADLVDGPVPAGTSSIQLTAAPTSVSLVPGTQVTLTGANTALLMHFDGANGAQTFTDAQGHTATLSGATSGTTALSTAQAMFGGASYLSNGNGSILVPSAPELQLTGDFTIEFFFYMSAVVAGGQVMFEKGNAAARVQYNAGKLYVYSDQSANTDGGQLLTVAASFIKTAAWQHIAIVKANGVWTAYVDGLAQATATSTNTFGNNTDNLYIGNYYNGANPQNGYLDELRVSRMARYTANFTPPTAAFALD